MRKILLTVIAFGAYSTQVEAQSVTDTVVTGAGYGQNVWYSLENDDQQSASATNWDLAFATTMSQTSELTTAIRFNHKVGTVYEIPSSDPSDLNAADTTGLYAWTPLYNSDSVWGMGALNNTADLGSFDYGWGTYDMATHAGINANRVFVVKFADGSYKKFTVSLTFATSSYTVTFSDLDNTNQTTTTIDFTAYTSKNFVYYSFATGLIDREPAAATWDLLFHQYPSFDYNPPYTVAGVFQNLGVEVLQVYPVNDPTVYTDYSVGSFSTNISEIGYDWKAYSGSWQIADSTVYFVKDISGSVWKLVMTGFSGSASGQYIFTKEKLSGVGIGENQASQWIVYPNPATDDVLVVVDALEPGNIELIDALGHIVYARSLKDSGLQKTSIPVTGMASGVYRLVLKTASSVSVQNLIIQH